MYGIIKEYFLFKNLFRKKVSKFNEVLNYIKNNSEFKIIEVNSKYGNSGVIKISFRGIEFSLRVDNHSYISILCHTRFEGSEIAYCKLPSGIKNILSNFADEENRVKEFNDYLKKDDLIDLLHEVSDICNVSISNMKKVNKEGYENFSYVINLYSDSGIIFDKSSPIRSLVVEFMQRVKSEWDVKTHLNVSKERGEIIYGLDINIYYNTGIPIKNRPISNSGPR